MLLATSCSSTSQRKRSEVKQQPSSPNQVSGKILVSAAASLRLTFSQLSKAFMQANPQAEITLNFASSGQLAQQIKQGAPAQIVAFADTAPMTELSDAGLIVEPAQIFAMNQLAIVVKPIGKAKATGSARPKNSTQVSSLRDLANVKTVSLCVVTAPCGKYAEQALAAVGVSIKESEITRGPDASATLRAVTQGDADAGIVYLTDALAAQGNPTTSRQVVSVPIEAKYNIFSTYPIAKIAEGTDTSNLALADAFMQYVLSSAGQKVLSEAGFSSP